MSRIRTISDDFTPANKSAIRQVIDIMRKQFPRITQAGLDKLPQQLHDPFKYKYRSILFVAEDALANVKGFGLLLHMNDLSICYLEPLSAAPGGTGGGVGTALYEWLREEAISLKVVGLFFECKVGESALVRDPALLRENIARMRFYERYGARPIINNDYATPVHPGDENLYYLVVDGLGHDVQLPRKRIRRIAAAILARKYGELFTAEHIARIANSFKDDPAMLRPPRYFRRRDARPERLPGQKARPIALVVNTGHEIHHVRERGCLEAPVRLSSMLRELSRTSLFERMLPKMYAEKFITVVHDKDYVSYLRRACTGLPPGKTIYPEVFPVRNTSRPPRKLAFRAGYDCIDPFTPLSQNAYLAARGAVNCTMTATDALLKGYHFACVLVRPPGHHAERRVWRVLLLQLGGGGCPVPESAWPGGGVRHRLSSRQRHGKYLPRSSRCADLVDPRASELRLPALQRVRRREGQWPRPGFQCELPVAGRHQRRTLPEHVGQGAQAGPRFRSAVPGCLPGTRHGQGRPDRVLDAGGR